MVNVPAQVEEYLKKYSLSYWNIETSITSGITNVIVVPAIAEFENIKRFLASYVNLNQTYSDSTLLLFVINNMSSSADEVKLDNQLTLLYLRGILTGNPEDETGRELLEKDINLGIIDAASPRKTMPEKDGGVGLARKIGMDAALNVFDFVSKNKKIIFTTDADCTLESGYITEVVNNFNKRDLAAAVVDFRHDVSGNDKLSEAIICYEIFLRYYVTALKYAGSPYAFHTIGSTLVCDYESYIKVEGMNKRKAAEDFYFLEKLAKNVKVEAINSTSVYPSGRGSWRVPFGTGQRVNRFLSGIQNEYTLYNPESFDILKKWLEIFNKPGHTDIEYYLNGAKEIHPELLRFLYYQNFEPDLVNILKNSKTEEQLQLQKSRWFDGFLTLKFIHHLRDNGFPVINMFDALDKMFDNLNISWKPDRTRSEVPGINVQRDYLDILRHI